jgi:DNA-binding XRE family transcriptional regulator
MDNGKRKRLEKAGWRLGDASDFLGLSPEESSYIDMRIALGEYIKKMRQKKHLRQADLAKRLHTSQSRVAKIEKADPSVTLDLMAKSAFCLGATRRDVAKAMG